VDVDEPRGHELPGGVDGVTRFALDPADRGDAAAVHGDVTDVGGAARTVDDGAAPDDEVVHGGLLCRQPAETGSNSLLFLPPGPRRRGTLATSTPKRGHAMSTTLQEV